MRRASSSQSGSPDKQNATDQSQDYITASKADKQISPIQSPGTSSPGDMSPPPSSVEVAEGQQSDRVNTAISLAQSKKLTGYKIGQVKRLLKKEGYNEDEINRAVAVVYPESIHTGTTHPDAQINLGLFSKIKGVLRYPEAFFEAVREEDEYKPIMMYLVVIGVISILLQVGMQAVTGVLGITIEPTGFYAETSLSEGITLMSSVCTLVLVPVVLAILVGATFVLAWIFHMSCIIFRGREPFIETYKVVVYALTPAIFASIFSEIPYLHYLNTIFTMWGIVLMVIGLKVLQKQNTVQAVGTILAPTLLVGGCIFGSTLLLFGSTEGALGALGF